MFMKHLSERVGAFSFDKYVGCADFCIEICSRILSKEINRHFIND